MNLEIRGPGLPRQYFSSIWGKYVSGFSHKNHCQASLKGPTPVQEIHQDMTKLDIQLRDDMPFFYLCALGRPRSGESNVHLVVTPKPNSVACTGSIYGFTFTIFDASAIRIRTLRKGWRGLGDEFTQCPNFQFGVQKYGYPTIDGVLDFGEHLVIQKPPVQGEV